MAKESTGHGSPMPLMKHGGPGRAGGGEEMGGKRGILHYLHRTAIQGHPDDITAITQQYQPGRLAQRLCPMFSVSILKNSEVGPQCIRRNTRLQRRTLQISRM